MTTSQTTIARELSTTLSRLNNLRNMPDGDTSGAESELSALLDMLPSGSGIDCGTKLDEDKATPQRLVFIVEYHHMNDVGMYCGWNTYAVTCVPTFDGIDIDVQCTDIGADFERESDDDPGIMEDDSEFQIETTCEMLGEEYHYALSRPIEAKWNSETRKTEFVDIDLRQAQEAYRASLNI